MMTIVILGVLTIAVAFCWIQFFRYRRQGGGGGGKVARYLFAGIVTTIPWILVLLYMCGTYWADH